MDTSTRVLSATIAPTTEEPSLGGAQSFGNLTQRDPLYYDEPLIILVRRSIALSDTFDVYF